MAADRPGRGAVFGWFDERSGDEVAFGTPYGADAHRQTQCSRAGQLGGDAVMDGGADQHVSVRDEAEERRERDGRRPLFLCVELVLGALVGRILR